MLAFGGVVILMLRSFRLVCAYRVAGLLYLVFYCCGWFNVGLCITLLFILFLVWDCVWLLV